MRATVAGDTSVGGGHAGGGRVHLGIVVAHDAHVVPGVLDLLRLDAHVEVLHVQIVEADRGVRLSLYPQTHSSGPGITVVKWGPPQSSGRWVARLSPATPQQGHAWRIKALIPWFVYILRLRLRLYRGDSFPNCDVLPFLEWSIAFHHSFLLLTRPLTRVLPGGEHRVWGVGGLGVGAPARCPRPPTHMFISCRPPRSGPSR